MMVLTLVANWCNTQASPKELPIHHRSPPGEDMLKLKFPQFGNPTEHTLHILIFLHRLRFLRLISIREGRVSCLLEPYRTEELLLSPDEFPA